MRNLVKSCLGCLALFAGTAFAQDPVAMAAKGLAWRDLGPARTTGRIVDLAVHPQKRSTFYVAAASGGLWKTENMGTTFKCVFAKGAISIGDIALSPANPEIVWVGTGEANNQRSSYHGTGIWLSDDGGKTWRCTGLADSHHVGRIVCHPTDPDEAYAAVLGHLYSENPERGLYRTRDRGKTWQCVKHLGSRVGFVDVAIDPKTPKVLYAASYERLRRAWHYAGESTGNRIWKSTDGGDSWRQLSAGLPGGKLGRIGLTVFPGDPRIVYTCIENCNPLPPGKSRPRGRYKNICQVYRSADRGEHWQLVNKKPENVSFSYYYGQIRVDPKDADRVYVLSVPLWVSADGGKTWKNTGASGCHVDHHALWIDPANPEHLILGNDGGLYMTWDRGKTWDSINTLPIVQTYAVSADNRVPYVVYYGTQDDGSWGVSSATGSSAGIGGRHNYKVNGGDGFYIQADPEDPDILYAESQFGGLRRMNLKTGGGGYIRPRKPRGYPALRFNWMSPLQLSPHNPRILYYGSQFIHRSLDRGSNWEVISPDLSHNDPEKLKGNVPHCTVTTIAESTKKAGLLWAGTDDGRLHVTVDGGRKWRDVSVNLPADVRSLWVSRVIASHADPAVAFVSYCGYREDDFRPLLYMTADYGSTWTPIHNDLPAGPINVVRQHHQAKDLLFVGSDGGVFFTLDCGGSWYRLENGLPDVAVHDLFIHRRDNELIAGTHGRGCFVLDLTPFKAMAENGLSRSVALLGVKAPRTLLREPSRPAYGKRYYRAKNPSSRALIYYWLGAAGAKEVKVQALDGAGQVIWEGKAPAKPGLQVFAWTPSRSTLRSRVGGIVDRLAKVPAAVASRFRERMNRNRRPAGGDKPQAKPSAKAPQIPKKATPPARRTQRRPAPTQRSARSGRPGRTRGRPLPPGTYAIKLVVGKFSQTMTVVVKPPVKPDNCRIGR